jgi:hypothetical protein
VIQYFEENKSILQFQSPTKGNNIRAQNVIHLLSYPFLMFLELDFVKIEVSKVYKYSSWIHSFIPKRYSYLMLFSASGNSF